MLVVEEKLDCVEERIWAAAILTKDGKELYIGVKPRRHHDVIEDMKLFKVPAEIIATSIQGFYTNKERFLTREEAYEVAEAAGQLRGGDGKRLYTEDMW